ncbi:MAG: Snf7 family protein [Nitrososphaerales archaeon]|jgi:division protein CdvB (Snf7/Vps24/ESCRT-III family)
MSAFARNWDQEKKGGKLRGSVNQGEPLKPRLDQASREIQSVIGRLDVTMVNLREKDTNLFNRIVSATQKHDSARASVYANELGELRKMNRMVTQSRLALEQILLRINTISDLGDIVATLAPATSVVSGLRQSITGLVPEAESGMSEISSLLGGILVDAGSASGSSIDFGVANEEAESVLSEAAAVAESRMERTFPDIPLTAAQSTEMEEA